MNFHETRMGKVFFEHTAPQTADALQSIAKSLDAPAPVFALPQEVPENFLRDLYLGNYDPSGELDTEVAEQCAAEILKNQTAIRAAVSSEVWALIEKTFSLIQKRCDEQSCQAFAVGFRTAMTMFAAGMTRPCGGKAA